MKPHSFSGEAVVLAKRNYGEGDRILSVYTKDHGRLSMIAKGVRKPESRKRGHIEVFNHIKFQVVTGHGLDVMTEAESIESFGEIRKSLKKVSLAYYFMEVIGRTTHEGEPNSEIYDLVIESLKKLKNEEKLKSLRLDFVLRLLTLLGFWPKGKSLPSPDGKLEEIIERSLNSTRVGKSMLK